MAIHESAAAGFERGAAAYERGRPSYPQAAVAWMVEHLHITPESTVLDLGAGTGKFTRLLLPSRPRVIAIEPVSAMRDELRRTMPGAEIVDATAEAIPLSDGCVDAVTAAQAFHWFATLHALAEIHRVLHDGGRLGLIWNRRDLGDPLQASLDAVVAPHRGNSPAHEQDRWRGVLDGNPGFRQAGEEHFRLEQPLNQDGVVDRVVSTSFIAAMDGATRAAIIDRVKTIVPEGATVVLRYVTDVFLFERT